MAFGGGAVTVALIALGWGASAPPNPIPIRVEFQAPADCSDVGEFYDGLRERTKRVRPAIGGEPGLELRVRLRQSEQKVYGELRIIDAQGETDTREVEGASCAEVVQALSLTTALAVDPTALVSASPAASASVPSVPRPPPCPPAKPETKPIPVPPRKRAVELEVGAEAFLAEVVSPRLSFGGAITARLNWNRDGALGPSLGLSLMHLRNDAVQTPSSAVVRWTALLATGCPWRWGDLLRVEPCAALIGGLLAATGRSVSRPRSSVRSWWSVGGVGRATLSMGTGTSIEFLGGASVPLMARSYVAGSPGRPVGETPRVSALAALGVACRF
ncbi:hypothetical protein ACFL5O_04265 [Myxococcota bacterium]